MQLISPFSSCESVLTNEIPHSVRNERSSKFTWRKRKFAPSPQTFTSANQIINIHCHTERSEVSFKLHHGSMIIYSFRVNSRN